MRLLEVYRRHLVNKLQVIVKMRSFSLSSTRLGKSIYVLIELPEPMEVACFASKWFPIVGFTLDVEMIATGNLSVDNPGLPKGNLGSRKPRLALTCMYSCGVHHNSRKKWPLKERVIGMDAIVAQVVGGYLGIDAICEGFQRHGSIGWCCA
ncbi:hypothetical protein HPP92_019486 [Vanilla planifolia]|uniref:Uncharacterized protein n=1 Tax=Vanilla planifolia TaxID=51239 RepID=A0A835UIZ0_VANPL|nr:hypothetical protein HPP92_019486 [Vanilla planifolia]